MFALVSKLVTSARFILVFLMVAILSVGACGKKEKQPEAPVARPVKLLTVGGTGSGGTREYPGRISPAQQAYMAFEVSGKIIKFPVREGQEVKKGAVLAQLDPRDYQASLDAAIAKKNAAEAEYKRARDLYEQDAASLQELDVARRNYEVARSNIRTARKAVEDTRLRAPFAGKVAKKLVDDFQNVQAKEPVLILQDESSLEIVINIPERDWIAAKPGVDEGEGLSRINAKVVFSTLPGRTFPVTVKEFATTADPVTRTFEATFMFKPPADVTIRPGMTAKLVVSLPEQAGTGRPIYIPASAVVSDDKKKAFVWRIDPENMQARRLDVELGEIIDTRIVIKSGLEAGDIIAVSGVHNLRDGMLVRPMESK